MAEKTAHNRSLGHDPLHRHFVVLIRQRGESVLVDVGRVHHVDEAENPTIYTVKIVDPPRQHRVLDCLNLIDVTVSERMGGHVEQQNVLLLR